MEVLGYAGVLAISDLPRIGRRSDNDYMAMDGWQGQDGYSTRAATRLFGKWALCEYNISFFESIGIHLGNFRF